MCKLFNKTILNVALVSSLLMIGCVQQTVEAENQSEVSETRQSVTFFGVAPELHEQAIKEGEKAKVELEVLKKERSLSATAKRVLAEAGEAEEQGNQALYLAKIQEYRKIVTEEPLKRAAEAYELEARVLFSQLKLEEAQKAIEQAVNLTPENVGYQLTLAEYLEWNGKYQQMERVANKALELIKKQQPVEEAKLAEAHSYLGLAYLNGGKYNQATQLLQQTLEMSKKLYGEEHPNVAISLNNLAGLYYAQGRYSEAEPLYKKAFAIFQAKLGEEHPNTKQAQENYQKMLQDKQQ